MIVSIKIKNIFIRCIKHPRGTSIPDFEMKWQRPSFNWSHSFLIQQFIAFSVKHYRKGKSSQKCITKITINFCFKRTSKAFVIDVEELPVFIYFIKMFVNVTIEHKLKKTALVFGNKLNRFTVRLHYVVISVKIQNAVNIVNFECCPYMTLVPAMHIQYHTSIEIELIHNTFSQ